ncbi:hypothetical protein [Motiliproteus coralliicola]|nr:hypothetical protein [Motiliproteus coralliicola]
MKIKIYTLITIIFILPYSLAHSIELPHREYHEYKYDGSQYGYFTLTIDKNRKANLHMKFSHGRKYVQTRLHASVKLINAEGDGIGCKNNHHLPAPGSSAVERETSCSFTIPEEQNISQLKSTYKYWKSDNVDFNGAIQRAIIFIISDGEEIEVN